MGAVAHHSPAELAAARKKYFWVFKLLIVLTVIEVAAVFLKKLPIPVIVVDAIIVIFSCAKAVAVGYWYMHLEHETKWLKAVALLPLIAFGYAFVLIIDTKMSRPISPYIPEPARTFKIHQGVPESELPPSAALSAAVKKLPPPPESSAAASSAGTPATPAAASAPNESTATESPSTPPANDPAADWR